MRKVVIVVVIVIVVTVVAALVVPHFVNVNSYRGQIQAELQKRLGRPVSLGNISLRLLPPRVEVQNVAIGEDPQFGTGEFATARELDVRVAVWPLIHKQVKIKSLTLLQPNIQLIKDQSGNWNFSTLGKPQSQAGEPAAQAPAMPPVQQQGRQGPPAAQQTPQQTQQKPAPSGQEKLAVKNLAIKGGAITLIDRQANTRGVYNNIDVKVNDFAPDKAFKAMVAAHLPGQGKETASFDGTVGPLQPNNMMATPIDGMVTLKQVSLSGLQRFLNTPALANTNAIISGSAKIKNSNGNVAADGSLNMQQLVLRGVDVGYPIRTDFNVSGDLAKETYDVKKANVTLGNAPVSLAGTIDAAPKPMQMNVKLTASSVSIQEAARLASAFGVAFSPNTRVAGQVSADVTAQGAANKPALNGTVKAANLNITGDGLKEAVTVPQIQLALSPREIKSNNFTASSGGTNLNAQFTLSDYSGAAPKVDTTLSTTNANIAALLQMAKAYGVSALNNMNGSGTITLNVHANGPIKSPSSMVFNGNGRVQNASIKTATMQQPLAIHNANLQFASNSATVQNLATTLAGTNANGNITVRNFAAPDVSFTLNADQANVLALEQAVGMATPQQTAPRQTAAASWSVIPRAEAQAQPVTGKTSLSIIDKMTGGGTVNIGKVIYDQMTLTNLHTNVNLNRGVIQLSPLTAQLFGGQEAGSITLDARTTPMAVNVNTKLTNVEANSLLSSTTSLKDTLYGLLAGNANTRFSVGSSSTRIAHSLNGTVNVDLTNGRIAKVDLLNQLSQIGKFAGLVSQNAQPFTDIVKLAGVFNIVNGVAQTNNLQATIPGATLAASGSVNLVNDALNLRLTTVLDRAMSQKAGGTGIGGFMQTALANNQGELVMPVIITGTFQNPQVAPDVQAIAQMKLKNLVPTSGNPGQLTSALGSILKGGANTGQPAAGAAGGLGGVVGAVTGALGGQQQTQQPPAIGEPQKQPQAPVPQPTQPPSANPGDAINNAIGSVLGQVQQQQQKKQQQQQQQKQQKQPAPPEGPPPPQ